MERERFYKLEIDTSKESIAGRLTKNPHVFIIGEVGQGKGFVTPNLSFNQALHQKN